MKLIGRKKKEMRLKIREDCGSRAIILKYIEATAGLKILWIEKTSHRLREQTRFWS